MKKIYWLVIPDYEGDHIYENMFFATKALAIAAIEKIFHDQSFPVYTNREYYKLAYKDNGDPYIKLNGCRDPIIDIREADVIDQLADS